MTRNRTEEFAGIIDSDSTTPFLRSAWQHFNGHENDAKDFAQHTIDFVEKWDWDWIKINPRATYFAEVWGAQFSPNDYGDVPVQKQLKAAIEKPADVASITAKTVAESDILQEHVEGARLIKAHFPDRVTIQTMFSPLSTLLQLAGLPLYPNMVVYGSETTFTRKELILEQPEEAKKALQAITDTFIDYLDALVADPKDGGAGLDGLFYAVTGTASDGYFSEEEFKEFSTPYDLQILEKLKEYGKISVLHTCQKNSHPQWFTSYPISALQWDQFLPDNPEITEDMGITPVGGVNYSLLGDNQHLDEVGEQLSETFKSRAGKPFLLAPSCTIPTPASDSALTLLQKA
ncbi:MULTISPECIES: uroporphyrinogen decarboxylase family protein [Bifidobacterium]|uniref:uroporphyrinogen decarboxylase family protein n=1 Tax=Bifidobacterium TaxID=1678 RepID=UPI0023F04C98|nr:uroporphyrinogen decarboxylase family protein [Bifidobacterium aquikefiri]